MERQIEVNGVTVELTKDQVNKILEQTKVKDAKELVKKEILEMLEKYKSNVRFLDEGENVNENGVWLFDIDYNEKNQHFWYSHDRVWGVFYEKYSINYYDFQDVMK